MNATRLPSGLNTGRFDQLFVCDEAPAPGPESYYDGAPLTTPDSYTLDSEPHLVVAAPGVLANDRGHQLTAEISDEPDHGTIELAANGSFTYTPNRGFTGTDELTYDATDAEGAAAIETLTIDVQAARSTTSEPLPSDGEPTEPRPSPPPHGHLPFTGAETWTLVAVGMGLFTAGTALLLVRRRHRSRARAATTP